MDRGEFKELTVCGNLAKHQRWECTKVKNDEIAVNKEQTLTFSRKDIIEKTVENLLKEKSNKEKT